MYDQGRSRAVTDGVVLRHALSGSATVLHASAWLFHVGRAWGVDVGWMKPVLFCTPALKTHWTHVFVFKHVVFLYWESESHPNSIVAVYPSSIDTPTFKSDGFMQRFDQTLRTLGLCSRSDFFRMYLSAVEMLVLDPDADARDVLFPSLEESTDVFTSDASSEDE